MAAEVADEPAPAIEDSPAPEPVAVVDDAPGAAVDPLEMVAAAPDPEPTPRPAPSTLGQAAIDSGLFAATSGRHADALAPIRRMSQAERVAFFS